MLHRDEAFDYIERQVRYDVLRDEGMNPIEATVKVLAEYNLRFASFRWKSPSYKFYVILMSRLYEMDYARKHKELKK